MVVLDRTRLTGRLIIQIKDRDSMMNLTEYIDSIRTKSIAVLGIGVSNLPLIRLLSEAGCCVTACDQRSLEQLGPIGEELAQRSVSLRLGENYLEELHEDIIFRTPGIMPFEEHLVKAKQAGSILTSEMEVFFQLCPCTIFAVTGSDGKTTTTTIISELLKEEGYTVHVGGNIGKPLLTEVPAMSPDDLVVLELSSFQLHSMQCKPDVSVITNISPNHLDKHIDYQDYIDAKRSIFMFQDASDRLILFADDAQTAYYASQAKGCISLFTDHPDTLQKLKNVSYHSASICKDGILMRSAWKDSAVGILETEAAETILPASEIRIPGEHNVRNYLAAFEAVRGYVSDETCRRIARSFRGVPHRLEEIRRRNGVVWINDSIASSPTRTIAGLKAVSSKPIVIAGGYDKKIPFDSLGDAMNRCAKAVILTGSTAEKIRKAVVDSQYYKGLPISVAEDLSEAVRVADRMSGDGDIIMLSPACASFDRYRNFEERGNHFRSLVMQLS